MFWSYYFLGNEFVVFFTELISEIFHVMHFSYYGWNLNVVKRTKGAKVKVFF
jgi:hypothetical protein